MEPVYIVRMAIGECGHAKLQAAIGDAKGQATKHPQCDWAVYKLVALVKNKPVLDLEIIE